MRTHLCLIVLLVVCAAPVGAQQFENPANGHFYELLPPGLWADHKAASLTLGGFLVTINDAEENQWILETFVGEVVEDYIYIGLTDEDSASVEGTFVWLSGEPVTYTNWGAATGEPTNSGGNEDVTIFKLKDGQFDNADGTWLDATGEAGDFFNDGLLPALVEIEPFHFVSIGGTTVVEVGGTVTLTALAQSPLSDTIAYQWFKDGEAIAGATESTYSKSGATIDDGGVYYAEASDGVEILTSNSITVTIVPEGSLPVAGLLGLIALGAGLAAGGTAALRLKR